MVVLTHIYAAVVGLHHHYAVMYSITAKMCRSGNEIYLGQNTMLDVDVIHIVLMEGSVFDKLITATFKSWYHYFYSCL